MSTRRRATIAAVVAALVVGVACDGKSGGGGNNPPPAHGNVTGFVVDRRPPGNAFSEEYYLDIRQKDQSVVEVTVNEYGYNNCGQDAYYPDCARPFKK